jgi:quinone-modifying oxidoreductase subunit QmoC
MAETEVAAVQNASAPTSRPEAPAATAASPAEIIEPDLAFIRELRSNGGDSLKACYQCATCSVTCELSPVDAPFPRKEMLWAQWGLKERLLGDPDVFLCYQCNDCTQRCPRGARPGDVLAAVRALVYRTFSFPAFMGRALANPRAMLPLLLFPALVLTGLLLVQHVGGERGFWGNLGELFTGDHVIYHHFLAHGLLEGLFVTGNVLIFLFAAVGFWRYYRNLRDHYTGSAKLEIGPAVVATIKEIVFHRRFAQCGQNRPRTYAHILVLFGFIGAAATAGLALVYMLIWMARNQNQAFDGLTMTNPIKWLGIASGVALIVGSTLMIRRRKANIDDVGANGYVDQLFLWMILIVAVSGMATWLLRLINVPVLAYPIYFGHLVVVFFLLWYMPYSKFSHMIYRGLALAFAHQTGRVEPRPKL